MGNLIPASTFCAYTQARELAGISDSKPTAFKKNKNKKTPTTQPTLLGGGGEVLFLRRNEN